MKVKQGYLLKITTWENDADNYNSATLDGLTPAQVEFYVAVAKMHYSGSSQKGCFGNMYEPSEEEEEEYTNAMRVLYKKHIDVVAELWGEDFGPEWIVHPDFLDMVMSVNCDLTLSSSEGRMTRVTDSIEISYTPVDIDLEDCTAKYD